MRKKETIKLCDGFTIETENGVKVYKNRKGGFSRVLNYINVNAEHIPDADTLRKCRENITREVFVWGFVDLTKAYGGHKVIIRAFCND